LRCKIRYRRLELGVVNFNFGRIYISFKLIELLDMVSPITNRYFFGIESFPTVVLCP
jgi:hypothetical protein